MTFARHGVILLLTCRVSQQLTRAKLPLLEVRAETIAPQKPLPLRHYLKVQTVLRGELHGELHVNGLMSRHPNGLETVEAMYKVIMIHLSSLILSICTFELVSGFALFILRLLYLL